MDKWFHPTHFNGCNSLFMLGLKFIHVSKRGHRCRQIWWPLETSAGQVWTMVLSVVLFKSFRSFWCSINVKTATWTAMISQWLPPATIMENTAEQSIPSITKLEMSYPDACDMHVVCDYIPSSLDATSASFNHDAMLSFFTSSRLWTRNQVYVKEKEKEYRKTYSTYHCFMT